MEGRGCLYVCAPAYSERHGPLRTVRLDEVCRSSAELHMGQDDKHLCVGRKQILLSRFMDRTSTGPCPTHRPAMRNGHRDSGLAFDGRQANIKDVKELG